MDFKEIGHISRGTLVRTGFEVFLINAHLQELGKMRIQSDGLIFKSSERILNVKHSEIDLAEWLRVARGYELKVLSREGHVFKFSGFKESVSINEEAWLHAASQVWLLLVIGLWRLEGFL